MQIITGIHPAQPEPKTYRPHAWPVDTLPYTLRYYVRIGFNSFPAKAEKAYEVYALKRKIHSSSQPENAPLSSAPEEPIAMAAPAPAAPELAAAPPVQPEPELAAKPDLAKPQPAQPELAKSEHISSSTYPPLPEATSSVPSPDPEISLVSHSLPEPELREPNPAIRSDLIDLSRRFWSTLPSTLIVIMLGLGGEKIEWFDTMTQTWISLALSIPIMLWAGWPIFLKGAQAVVKGNPNLWTLLSLATSATFFYAVGKTITASLSPASFAVLSSMEQYFMVVDSIISLALLSQIVKLKARVHTSTLSSSSLGLR